MKFNLIDNQDRNKLNEGRNYGMGFALAKRDKNTLTLVQPISPCKDYLNDQVYSELTGNPYSVYGLDTKKYDIFNDGFGYLVMSILTYRNNEEPRTHKRDLNALETNYKNQQKLINWFEKQFKLDKQTKILKLEDNKFLAISPLFWVDGTYKISLLSLLLRNGIFYTGGDCMEFLNTTTHDAQDTYSIRGALPKIKEMLNGNIPKQDLDNIGSVHDMGICTYKFPNTKNLD